VRATVLLELTPDLDADLISELDAELDAQDPELYKELDALKNLHVDYSDDPSDALWVTLNNINNALDVSLSSVVSGLMAYASDAKAKAKAKPVSCPYDFPDDSPRAAQEQQRPTQRRSKRLADGSMRPAHQGRTIQQPPSPESPCVAAAQPVFMARAETFASIQEWLDMPVSIEEELTRLCEWTGCSVKACKSCEVGTRQSTAVMVRLCGTCSRKPESRKKDEFGGLLV
jgi:hypothetical protein